MLVGIIFQLVITFFVEQQLFFIVNFSLFTTLP